MNHQNSVTLEGVISDIRIGRNEKGKDTVSIFMKSTQTKTFKDKEFMENFSQWIQVWGKDLQATARTLRIGDTITVTGSFKSKFKEMEFYLPDAITKEFKKVMHKNFSVVINVETITKEDQNKPQIKENSFAYDDLPF